MLSRNPLPRLPVRHNRGFTLIALILMPSEGSMISLPSF